MIIENLLPLRTLQRAAGLRKLENERRSAYMSAFDSLITAAKPLVRLSGANVGAGLTSEGTPCSDILAESLCRLYSSTFEIYSRGIPPNGIILRAAGSEKNTHMLLPPVITDYQGVRRRTFPVKVGNHENPKIIKIGAEFFPKTKQGLDSGSNDTFGEERYWFAWDNGIESYCLLCKRNYQFDDLGIGERNSAIFGTKSILTRVCGDGTRVQCTVDQDGITLQGTGPN